ncbi:CDP-alcohol phosphatidyltransferase family protein [Altererythrobacter lutimaris]|uniref:CDP-alcohol phosphatidyltransferase family protein n=1 Tax=Altererythrobacter lutimaris TaxID=2743979 RepID=A0A850HCB7_9SPHN|nr:CDP-alcohol phosphatidyltransferase family protein [Altererythrobacter lutimaris]NVE94945.1 CDP-alcohol phosphatidyltransferase family protein [Altererythrobacter lutimaris]
MQIALDLDDASSAVDKQLFCVEIMQPNPSPKPLNSNVNDASLTSTGRVRAVQHPVDVLIFHPLAARLAKALSHTPITPNMVSFAGGLAVVLAAIIYVHENWAFSVALGFLVHASWHVLDGADGDLARLTGKSSPQGEVFDGICDYAGHIALYLILAWALSQSMGWLGWVLGVGSGLSRIPQTIFYESQRRQYMQWVHGIPWLRTSTSQEKAADASGLSTTYLKAAGILAPSAPAIERALADPNKAEAMRTRLVATGPEKLFGSTLLGQPYRTLALGASMLTGSPVWYFLFEIIVLHVVLAFSIFRARRTLTELSIQVDVR